MDWTDRKDAVNTFLKKYRWAFLILLTGLLLMGFPKDAADVHAAPSETQIASEEKSLQQELEELLSQLDGAGKVTVLLSMESGSRTHYQTDVDQSKSQDSQDKRSETVIVTASDRNEVGLVQQIDSPIYRGAVILCQGGNDPGVKLAIVDAVSTATGLTSDKISVWKMK